jgi:hypothetical protein
MVLKHSHRVPMKTHKTSKTAKSRINNRILEVMEGINLCIFDLIFLHIHINL